MNENQRILVEWLNRLAAEIQQLHGLLLHEQQCLLERRFVGLPELAEQKNARVSRIDAMLLQLSGQPQQLAWVVDQLIETLDLQGGEMGDSWQRLKQRMEECRLLNETNGATIALLQEQNHRALELLFGQRRDRVCYGADGQGQTPGSERLLAST